jgi:hypothetical protein
MAQINVKDDLYFKAEWFNLLIKLGSADMAIGALVRVWKVAQIYWYPKRELIPIEIWESQQLNSEVINCGLAVHREGGIYARGTEDCCDWMFVQLEKSRKAGLRSAESRKNKTLEDSTQVEKFANYSTCVKNSANSSTQANLITITSVSSNFNKKEEEESPTASLKIPSKILNTIKMNEGYPDTVIEEIRKDAELIFIGKPELDKNWTRFIAHYFKHEKQKIREVILKIAKSEKELSKQKEIDEEFERVALEKKQFSGEFLNA